MKYVLNNAYKCKPRVTLFVWFVFFYVHRTCNISYLTVNLKKKVKLNRMFICISEISSPESSKTEGNMN